MKDRSDSSDSHPKATRLPDDLTATASFARCLDKLLLPKHAFLLLGAYFALQLAVRHVTSGAVDLDEAEQILFTQQLQWGYGPQPPLYTWIQFAIFSLFGISVFSLSLFKNTLLLALFTFVFLAGRQVFAQASTAVVAALGLFFSSTIAWECQRDLTHTVLATTMAAATWFAVFVLYRRPTPLGFVWLGLCFALGTLSNYSYLLIWIGLVLAMLLSADTRRLVLCWPMALAFAVSLSLLLPHAWWAINNLATATMSTNKFKMAESSFTLMMMGQAFGRLIRTVLSQVFLPMALFLLLTGKPWRLALSGFHREKWPGQIRLAMRTMVMMVALIGLTIVILHVTKFKGRWFTPLLVPVPLILAATQLHRLTPRVERRFAGAAILIMLAVCLLIPARVRFARWRSTAGLPTLNAPIATLLDRSPIALEPGITLIASDGWLAGNLRLVAPQLRFLTPTEPGLPLPFDHRRTFYVWDASLDTNPPSAWIDRLRLVFKVEPQSTNAAFAEAPLVHWPERHMRLGFLPVQLSTTRDQTTFK